MMSLKALPKRMSKELIKNYKRNWQSLEWKMILHLQVFGPFVRPKDSQSYFLASAWVITQVPWQEVQHSTNQAKGLTHIMQMNKWQ